MKLLIYLSLIASIAGANAGAISLGAFKLSAFRLIFFMMVIGAALDVFREIRRHSLSGFLKETYARMKGKASFYSLFFLVFWLAYAVISVLWVMDTGAWVKAVYFIGIGVVGAWILHRYLTSVKDILTAFLVLYAVSLPHHVLGWYEVFTGNYFFIHGNMLPIYINKMYPVSTFGNTNNFSVFLYLFIIIAAVCWGTSQNQWIRWSCPVAVASAMGLLYYTQSRASQLGLVMAVGVALVLWVIRWGYQRKILNTRKLRNILLLGAALFALLLILQRGMIASVFQEIRLVFDNLPFAEYSPDHTRIHLWLNGISFFLKTYGFGTGAGNIEYWMQHYHLYYTWEFYNIHSLWLEILVGYGWIVFMGYLVYYFRMMLGNYWLYMTSRNKEIRALSLAVFALLTGFTLASIGPSSMLIHEWFWMIFALLVSYQGVQSGQNQEIDHENNGEPEERV